MFLHMKSKAKTLLFENITSDFQYL